MSKDSVVLKISALDDTRQAFDSVKRNLDGLDNSVGTVRGRIEEMQPTFERMATIGAASFAAVAGVLALSVKEARNAEAAQFRLAQILRTTNGASEDQIAALNAQADALERVGVVSGEAITQAQAQLATFDLQAETIKTLTPAILDYVVAEKGANATTEDLKQLTNGLAQALNGNFASLTRVGFVLDDVTKEMISNGTEAERAAALVTVLNSTYEGFNEAARQTAEGSMVALRNEFGRLQETLGQQLIPAVETLTTTLTPLITQFISFAEQNPELVKNIALAAAAITGLVAIMGTLGLLLPPIIAGFGLLMTPVGLVIGVMGALSFAVMQVVRILQLLQTDSAAVWQGIKLSFKEAVDFILSKTLDPLVEKLKSVIDYLKRVRDGIASIGGKVSSAFSFASSLLPGRAAGGPVMNGQPYMVGERGPELFVPSGAGRIVPNYALAGAGSAPVINLTITGNSFMGEEDMVEKIGNKLIGIVKQNMRL